MPCSFSFAGQSVELLTLRSLPRGNYLVPLFIGDKQGLSQKQTVHVRICPCASGFTCVEHADAGVGLLVGALSPVCAAFVALAGQWSVGVSWDYGSSPQAIGQGYGVCWGRGQPMAGLVEWL